jgi:D-methionine transport system permease protein
MGGIVGAGGLGALAYQYGYNGYKPDYMLVTVALLVVLVQLLQMLGDWLVARYSRK